MSLLKNLSCIIEEGQKIWDEVVAEVPNVNEKLSRYDGVRKKVGDPEEFTNRLINFDNLKVMKHQVESSLAGGIQLIYIDPPFFSKADYKADIKLESKYGKKIPVMKQKAYKDSWEKGMTDYLTMLTARLFGIKELLSDEGCLWIHLDWHAVHYVKIIMDEIFSEKNFVNEVVWNYKSGGVSKRRYARKHDTLLFYSKTKNYDFKPQKEKSYNRGFKPYRFKGVKEYRDEAGWYTMVNMKDVWQIDMVGRTSAERTGYSTQKPEALLERIVESCSDEGDICADYFGGSGTLAAVADKMNRKWISCDKGKLSTINSQKRLMSQGAVFDLYENDEQNDYNGLNIDVEITVERVADTDKIIAGIDLVGYRLSDEISVPVDDKDRKILDDVLEHDPLQLIDYFAVDFEYDGKTICPDVYAAKDKEVIETHLSKLKSGSGAIAVKVTDIFGNISTKEV